jgi:hypothetical protein
VPGEAVVRLDGRGRLLELLVIPPREQTAGNPPDWSIVLKAAGLEANAVLVEDVPRWTPPVFADVRKAWQVETAEGFAFRAEAAALGGRVVWFHLSDERERPSAGIEPAPSQWWLSLVWPILVFAGLMLAARNIVRVRSDVRGGARLFALSTVAAFGAWVCAGHHIASAQPERWSLSHGIGYAVFASAVVTIFYLALEPIVRRRWPWRLSAWSRAISGRWRDPLVGRDILVGVAIGIALNYLDFATLGIQRAINQPQQFGISDQPLFAAGERLYPSVTAMTLTSLATGISGGITWFLLTFLVGLLLRKEWLTWLGVLCLITALALVDLSGPWFPSLAVLILWTAVVVFVIARFGLLAVCALFFGSDFLRLLPPLDAESWYFWQAAIGIGVLLIPAAAGFCTATRVAKLFKDGFFGDD